MSRIGSLAALVIVVASVRCASVPAPRGTLEAEARQFMEDYARDLRAGNRDALAARYDARGAYMAGSGSQTLATADSIRTIYRGAGWSAPAAFEWRGLSYEAVGPEAVLVSGRFEWRTTAGPTLPASYTAVLVRRNGTLRIRAEHEDVDPIAMRERLCARPG